MAEYQAPMVWAFVVRAAAAGPPFAEAVVEVGERLYGDLVADALDSGFALAVGEPPLVTGTVELGAGRFERMVLVGGRQVWEPGLAVEVSPAWRAAAEVRGGVVVVIVPPGTWPLGLMDLDSAERERAFGEALEEARTAGQVLHGMVALEITV
ncbi:hypothetical protein F7Q99_25705 [Streptomyces kaniharaensis]|uniref:Uncharacterized protein n=1 Tax=Streptomyces kaniharaensis TaxID=212423 RepID=A0A6N7L067_9ACTN|nr:hypothetical protein [Streptomyces kaniharaensis]MQS15574.1 hypothetical protein [Streptomyces kaniharaensis]